MGSRFVLPLVVVVLIVAAAATWFLMDGGKAAPDTPVATRVQTTPGGLPATPEKVMTPTASVPSESPPRRVATNVDPVPVAPASEETGSGASAVVGRVVDKLGNPVVGARVEITRPFGEVAARTPAQGVSGKDGSFEINGAIPGQQRLSAFASGFAPLAGRQVAIPKGRHDVGTIVMSEGAILTGVVVDAVGTPVVGAELTDASESGHFMPADAVFGGPHEPLAVTGPQGEFRIDQLACGRWQIRVKHDEQPSKVFEGTADLPGAIVSGLEFRLPPGASIAGRVVGVPEDGPSVTVRARPVSREGGFVAFGSGGSRTAPCDPNGAFVLEGVDANETYDLQVRASTPGRTRTVVFGGAARSDSVRARAGDRGVELFYNLGATIALRVLDADTGLPVTALNVSSGVDWTMPLRGEDGRVLREFEGGRVEIADQFPRKGRNGTTVKVTATGYYDWVREDLELEPGRRLDLGDVRLQPAPTVVVNVFDDATGAPVSGALVTLKPRPKANSPGEFTMEMDVSIGHDGDDTFVDHGGRSRRGRTDDTGVATLSSLEGEDTVLRVESDDHAPYELAGLFLPRGERVERDVRLSRGGAVVVTVEGADGVAMPAVEVEHRTPDADPNRQFFSSLHAGKNLTDADGVVVFAHLSPGVHSFRVAESRSGGGFFGGEGEAAVMIAGAGMSGAGEPWTEVEVTDGGRAELLLEASPRGQVEGRIREGGVPLAGATLRLNDRKSGDDPMAGFSMPDLFGGGPSAKTDGDGYYVFHDVTPGEYTIEISHPARAMPAERDVDVRERGGAVDVHFDVDLPISVVEGRIVDEKGKGIADVDVWVERVSGGGGLVVGRQIMMFGAEGTDEIVTLGGGGGGESARTDKDGYFRLRGVPTDVDLVVKASSPYLEEGESDAFRVAPDQVKGGVDLEMRLAGKLEVSVVEPDGSPSGMCLVTATYLDDEEVEPRREVVGPSGITTVSGMRPGTWSIGVRSLGDGPLAAGAPGDGTPVQVLPGETATVRVPAP